MMSLFPADISLDNFFADKRFCPADGAQYLGFPLPFSITQLVWIEAILVGELPISVPGYRPSAIAAL